MLIVIEDNDKRTYVFSNVESIRKTKKNIILHQKDGDKTIPIKNIFTITIPEEEL